MIVRVVLMRWKERVTPSEIERAKAAYLDLATKVPGIVGAYWGRAREPRKEKFHGGVVLLAETPAAIAAYDSLPDHTVVAKMVDAMVTRFASADLEA